MNLAKQIRPKTSPVCGDDILHDGYVTSSALFEKCLVLRNIVWYWGLTIFEW